MRKILKTFHDISLGLFINASYSITQGDVNIANIYVLIGSIVIMYSTNKGE